MRDLDSGQISIDKNYKIITGAKNHLLRNGKPRGNRRAMIS